MVSVISFRTPFVLAPTILIVAVSEVLGQVSFRGRVVDLGSNAPVASASVSLAQRDRPELVADVLTDRAGEFSLPAMPAGKYRVMVSKANYNRTTLDIDLQDSTASSGNLPRLYLVRRGVITGRVTDENGNSVSDVLVSVVERTSSGSVSWHKRAAAKTNKQGQYRLFGLGFAEMAICALIRPDGGVGRAGTWCYPNDSRLPFVQWKGMEEHHRIDIVRTERPLFHVQGRAISPGIVGRTVVSLRPHDGLQIAYATQVSDEAGNFSFRGIPANSYDVFAAGTVEGWSFQHGMISPAAFFGRTSLDVTNQDINDVEVKLEPGRTERFKINVQTEGAPACESHVRIVLRPQNDWSVDLDRTEEGRSGDVLTVHNLAPVQYAVTAADNSGNCFTTAPSVLDFQGTTKDATTLNLVSAGLLRIALPGARRSSDFAAVLIPSAPLDVRMSFADANSRFTFDGLQPGIYYAGIRAAYESRHETAHRVGEGLTEVKIVGGESTAVEIHLPRDILERRGY